jgi:Ca2+-binding EF-hand superfamily protein
MKDYVSVLFKNFDINLDGLISFEELVDGLKTININLTAQEKRGLMKRFDYNRDGEISEEEIYRVLAPYEQRSLGSFSPIKSMSLGSSYKTLDVTQSFNPLGSVNVNQIIERIKRGANKYPNIDSFVKSIMIRYDTDSDGQINQLELSRGLEGDGIRLSKTELTALFNHIDIDRDGSISFEEILNALAPGRGFSQSTIGSSVDTILKRIKLSADRFKTLEDFCRFVFNKFDTDRSGSLSFNELSAGLDELGIIVSVGEKMDLMRTLDTDGDGEVGFMEFYNGLSGFSGSINLDSIMAKISRGADQYRSIEDYVSTLFRRFDINRDGAVSYQELRDGLRSMKVALNDNEVKALFTRLDTDHDGNVSQEELYDAIA